MLDGERLQQHPTNLWPSLACTWPSASFFVPGTRTRRPAASVQACVAGPVLGLWGYYACDSLVAVIAWA